MELVPVLAWWLACLALLAAALPLAAWLLPDPRAAAGLALPLAFAVLTVVGLWVGHLALGWVAMGASLLALLGGSAAAWRAAVDGAGPALARPGAGAGAAFTAAYASYVLLRGAAPGITPDGEQFLDVGLLKTVLRAPALPPEDMWFAGEPVQYYYGGHLLTAQLVELTGVAPRHAFHLGIASALAATAVAAGGLGWAIVAGADGSPLLGAAAATLVAGFGGHAGALGYVPLPPDGFPEAATVFALPGAVAVFPLLEALEGTLHAHVLAAPLLVLAAGLAWGVYRREGGDVGAGPGTRMRCLVALPPVVGALVFTSTWAAGTALGVLFLALVFAPALPLSGTPLAGVLPRASGGLTTLVRRIALALPVVAVLGGLSAVAVAPFLTGSGRTYGVALLDAGARSQLGQLLRVYGGFVVVFAGALLAWLDTRRRRVALVGAWLAATALAVVLPGGLAVLALCGPLLVVGAWCLLRGVDATADRGGSRQSGTQRPTTRAARRPTFAAVLLLAGAGLVVLVEFLHVLTDGPGNRFNTVFKTSMHVWVLWSVAAGAVVGVLAERWRVALERRAGAPGRWTGALERWRPKRGPSARTLAALAAIGLLAPTAAYGALAVPDHVAGAGPLTVDGTRQITASHPDEMAAIRALDRRIAGQPTMVAAPGVDKYQWSASPAASLTGIPTVAGWSHESQYRSPEAYLERVRDTDALFAGDPEQRVALLREYDVRYVYVGPTERDRYPDVGPFDHLRGVSVFYENGAVTVYAVDQSALAVPAGAR